MAIQRIPARGFLFDLDGVLADSREEVEDHWRQFARWYDLDGEALVARTHGVRDSETITRELAHLSDEDVSDAIQRFRRLEVMDTARTVEVSGASILLKSLPSELVCLVTSCTRPLAEARLGSGGIDLPANRVFSEDVTNGKPDPEPYLKGADLLGVDIAQCVVFEDSPSGLRAATDSGATPIGIATTQAAECVKEQLGPGALVVHDLSCVGVERHEDMFVLTVDTFD